MASERSSRELASENDTNGNTATPNRIKTEWGAQCVHVPSLPTKLYRIPRYISLCYFSTIVTPQ